MEDALEVEGQVDRSLEMDLIAAVELVRHGGRRFFDACQQECFKGLSLERWKTWATRFGDVAARMDEGTARGAATWAGMQMLSMVEE